MRPLIIVMLCTQAAFILATILAVLREHPDANRRRPVLSTVGIMLVIGATTSYRIADNHQGSPGADLLQYGSGVLLGMGIVSLLMLLRQRLGTGTAA
jgi:hypothetical protein